ncbi:MAG TPA: c-type cytochrome [Candidatus Eisenbacteria bacterium]|nr:c-type cytochrome [Candidatus Eisenbacteria bacterium]
MKRIVVVLAAALLVAAWGVASAEDAAPAKEAPGKALYLKYSCNSCHTMAAQKIEKKAAASEGEAKEAAATKEAGEETSSTKKKAPDLSAVGTVHKADFIVKYMQKLEAIKEKKHMKKFKGTDEELTQLAAWLVEQKDVEAAKKANEGASKEAASTEAAKEAPAETK